MWRVCQVKPIIQLKFQCFFAFQLTENLPDEVVHVDRAQIEQAILNLLKNAHESDFVSVSGIFVDTKKAFYRLGKTLFYLLLRS